MELVLIGISLGAGWVSVQVYLALMAKRHPETTGVQSGAAVLVGLGSLALAYGLASASADGLSAGYLASAVVGALLLVIAPLTAFRKSV